MHACMHQSIHIYLTIAERARESNCTRKRKGQPDTYIETSCLDVYLCACLC